MDAVIGDDGCCPCGHPVLDGYCVVVDPDDISHFVPYPHGRSCECCGIRIDQLETRT